jgi:hypothetical protein
LDALELGAGVDLDSDVASILGADPKGLCAGVLRQDRPIEVPEGRLCLGCLRSEQQRSAEHCDDQQTWSLLSMGHVIPP